MKWLTALLLTLILTENAFAIFCPTSFNSVNIGDSIAEVTRVCGSPVSQKTYEKKPPGVQEWNYYIHPIFGGQDVVTMKFIVKDDRVINISITGNPDPDAARQCNDAFKTNNFAIINSVCNNPFFQRERSVSSTQLCGPAIVSIGDSAQQAEMYCGKPAFVKNYDQPDGNGNGGPTITEYTYGSNPPITFIFENGRLSDRQ